ncbi:MAG: HAD-IB family hydrolase [Steroidobacteraceae bacterium]
MAQYVRLAIFDLDGTITRHDTLAPYALGFLVRKRAWRLPALLLVAPTLLGYVAGLVDRGGLKSAFIRAALGGCRRKDLQRWTETFVVGLLAHGVFPQALEAIRAHARAGDHLVLLSASTDLYVPAIAQALGFQEVICTGVRWDDERLDGRLTTPNRRGEEKARCVTALRARHSGMETAAYGNAASDLEHLRLVEQGVLVNGSTAARRAAAKDGITTVTWTCGSARAPGRT